MSEFISEQQRSLHQAHFEMQRHRHELSKTHGVLTAEEAQAEYRKTCICPPDSGNVRLSGFKEGSFRVTVDNVTLTKRFSYGRDFHGLIRYETPAKVMITLTTRQAIQSALLARVKPK